jgi:hypothetical protein
VPAKRTPKKAAVEPSAPQGPKTTEPTAADDATPDDDPPLNRAERRAKGKGKGATPPPAKAGAIRGGGRGPAPSPRQWANRRSG